MSFIIIYHTTFIFKDTCYHALLLYFISRFAQKKKKIVICKQSTLPLKSKGTARPTFGATSWHKCGSVDQL